MKHYHEINEHVKTLTQVVVSDNMSWTFSVISTCKLLSFSTKMLKAILPHEKSMQKKFFFVFMVLFAASSLLPCLASHIFPLFSYWFKMLNPCFVTSYNICKMPFLNVGNSFSSCSKTVCTKTSLLFCYLSIYALSTLQKSFLLLKYALKWNAISFGYITNRVSAITFKYFLDFWDICLTCYSHRSVRVFLP